MLQRTLLSGASVHRGRLALVASLLLLAAPVWGQPGEGRPLEFGVELELRGREVTPTRTSERTFEDYRRVLEGVVRAYGGNPADITRVAWSVDGPDGRPRPLMRAEWRDPRGRLWKVEPEWVTGGGRQQVDFELITPKLTDPAELERVVRSVRDAGRVVEGLQSSVHIHVNGRGLIGPNGNATGLINLVNLHESYEPLLRRLFNPVRGAGIFNGARSAAGAESAYVNRFNRPLYLDHPDLLAELAKLPAHERTVERMEALFRARAEAELRAHGASEMGKKGWKYRSLNLINILNINPNLPAEKGSVEFRMNDLNLQDPTAHRLQVELYRALVRRAQALAAEGKVAPPPPRRTLPRGENPATYFTSADPAVAGEQVRAMLRQLGLDPARYEALIARNVRAPPVLSETAFRERLNELRLRDGVRSEVAGTNTGEGDRALRGALEAVGANGGRGEILLRIPAGEAGLPASLRAAESLALRANAALYLEHVSHSGVRVAAEPRQRITVQAGANEVLLRIDANQLNLTRLDASTRLLVEGVSRAVPLAGSSGLPATNRTLAEHARAFAERAEGRTLSARTIRGIELLEARGGSALLLPLLAWEAQSYVPDPTKRDLRFRAENYLRKVIAESDKLTPGRGRQPGIEALRGEVRAWARATGMGELLLRSLLPPASTAPVDALARYRRPDGTLRWRPLIRDRALHEVGGLAHFGLALFLKEVAVVAATGDRARIEEFFEGLLTTDFYKHYGMFVAGARLGEVAYNRYLQRYVKPRFVGGLLKTNLILAAGMALPLIVEGKFEGRAFAISLTSLGLSSAAVKAGVSGIKWVMDLKKARDAGTLARMGAGASRLARVGGWFYTAVELAVILYVAEELDQAINEHLDRERAQAAVAEAGQAFLAAARDPGVTPESLAEAAQAYHEAWIDYRNFLYAPLHQDEALFAMRLEKVARRAKIKADERQAALERVGAHAALRANIERRYGSLQGYADHLLRRDESDLQETVQTYLDSYNRSRETHLEEVYRSNRRGSGILDGVDNLDWHLAGAPTGAAGDPWGSRSDVFATWGRYRARGALESALAEPSGNRLEAYQDERAILNAVARSLRSDGRRELAAVLDRQTEVVDRLARADQALIEGNGIIDLAAPDAPPPADAEGLSERLREASEGR